MTQNLKEFFESKTDRQLMEESIQQNIVISNKIDSIGKKVGFIFLMTLFGL
jgi:hypothetical protein